MIFLCLNSILEFLNNNSGGIVALFTILLCLITFWYAKTTRGLLENNKLLNFEDNLFRMINNIQLFISNLIHNVVIKDNDNKNIEKDLKGIEIFKHFSLKFISLYNKRDDNIILRNQGITVNYNNIEVIVKNINREYGSIIWQIMKNINFILNFIDKNEKIIKNATMNYKDYLISQLPIYLKFIITIFYIYLPYKNYQLPSLLVKQHQIIDLNHFKNYISESYFQEFETKFNEKMKIAEE